MEWFLYDNGLRLERVKEPSLTEKVESCSLILLRNGVT